MAPSHGGGATASGGGMGSALTVLVTKLGDVTTYMGNVTTGLNAMGGAFTQATADANANVTAMDAVAVADLKVAEAKKQLAADTQFAAEQAAGHARAMQGSAAATKDAANAAADLRSSLEAATEAQTGSATSTANGIQVSGQAKIITMQLAAATAEQTAALVELLKQQNLYTASLQNTLSVATGWSDYLANLKSALDDGTTSILQYKLALANFLNVLETQFPTATGKAKAALQEMIGVVQRLMDTAVGPTGPVDNSYGGALNKQFNKP